MSHCYRLFLDIFSATTEKRLLVPLAFLYQTSCIKIVLKTNIAILMSPLMSFSLSLSIKVSDSSFTLHSEFISKWGGSRITFKLFSSRRHKCPIQRLSNSILRANILNLPCPLSWPMFKHEWLLTGQNPNLGKMLRNVAPWMCHLHPLSPSVLKCFCPQTNSLCSLTHRGFLF